MTQQSLKTESLPLFINFMAIVGLATVEAKYNCEHLSQSCWSERKESWTSRYSIYCQYTFTISFCCWLQPSEVCTQRTREIYSSKRLKGSFLTARNMAPEASDSAHLINPISLKSAYFPASKRHKKRSAFFAVVHSPHPSLSILVLDCWLLSIVDFWKVDSNKCCVGYYLIVDQYSITFR